jgi:mannosyltransferase
LTVAANSATRPRERLGDLQQVVQLAALGIVVIGITWRFATLGVQSYWSDEAYTVDDIRSPFMHMLHSVRARESTPPLYFIAAWLWAKVFGTGEAGLRSLSAVLGSITVLVSYLLGNRLAGRTAGALAAALVAANPFLVWYSQEARSYALLVLLTATSLLLTLRADERRRRRDYGLWALTAALALATHYFAAFFVFGEVLWLLSRKRNRRAPALIAVGALGIVEAALVPLAAHQETDPLFGGSLVTRIAQIPKQFVVGFNAPSEDILGLVGIILVLAALVVAARSWKSGRDPRVTTLLVAFAACGVVLGIAVSAVGNDYLNTRNVIAALVPTLVFAAWGFSLHRAMLLAAAALILLSATVDVAIAVTPAYQRTDFRQAVRSIPPAPGRIWVLATGYLPVHVYLPGSGPLNGSARAGQIAFMSCGSERAAHFRPPAGFRLIRQTREQDCAVNLYRRAAPALLVRNGLASRVTGVHSVHVLRETAAVR